METNQYFSDKETFMYLNNQKAEMSWPKKNISHSGTEADNQWFLEGRWWAQELFGKSKI